MIAVLRKHQAVPSNKLMLFVGWVCIVLGFALIVLCIATMGIGTASKIIGFSILAAVAVVGIAMLIAYDVYTRQ